MEKMRLVRVKFFLLFLSLSLVACAGKKPKEEAPVSAPMAQAAEAEPQPSLGKTEEIPSSEKPKNTAKDLLKKHLEQEAKREAEEQEQREKESVLHEAGKYHIELAYAFRAFPNYDFDTRAAFNSVKVSKGGTLSFLYFPVAHSYGRLGLGLSAGYYYAKSDDLIKGVSPSFVTYGLKGIYEFQYWVAQLLVPFVMFGWDQVDQKDYAINTGTPGTAVAGSSFSAPYYGGGLALNLNRLESQTAAKALADLGVRKFYLVYTLHQRAADTDARSGSSHFVGLRFEF